MPKKEKQFEIKITGSGTQKEIVNALEKVVLLLHAAKLNKGLEHEGATLMTEINEEN
jgi:hypothetical protein